MAKKVIVENKAVSLSETKTRFGFGQIGNTTPPWVKNAFRVFFYVTSVLTIGLDIFTDIPTDVKLMVSKYVIQGNLFAHAISKMCGLESK